MKRVRQVITKSPCRVVYKFPSIKLRRTVYCESTNELYYAYLLDSDHGDVISFQEQPGKIKYLINGKTHTYTPDFLVKRVHKTQIVEVKPASKVSTKENKILFEIIEAVCLNAGYEFVVVTDIEICEQPRLNNVRLCREYGRIAIHPRHQIYCQDFFSLNPTADLGDLFEFFACRKEGKGVVYALLYWGVIGFDIKNPLGPDSTVYLPS